MSVYQELAKEVVSLSNQVSYYRLRIFLCWVQRERDKGVKEKATNKLELLKKELKGLNRDCFVEDLFEEVELLLDRH